MPVLPLLRRHPLTPCTVAATLVFSLCGCSNDTALKGPVVPDEGPPRTPPTAIVETAEEAEAPLVYPVPNGSPEQLLEFINDMAAQEPKGATENERTEISATE